MQFFAVPASLANIGEAGGEISLTPSWVHRHWTVEDGLPVNTLSAAALDHEGYLWVGTYDGLVRFDGVRFTVFRPNQVPELASPRIHEVVATDHGLWILTQAGTLTRYRDRSFEQMTAGDDADGRVRLLKKHDDVLWIVSEHALFRVDGEGVPERKVRVPVDRDLTGIVHDRAGGIWLTASQGIARVVEGELTWHDTASRVLGGAAVGDGLLFFRQGDVPLELRAGLGAGQWRPFRREVAPGIGLFDTSSVAQLPWGGSLLINRGRYFLADEQGLALVPGKARALALKLSFASVAGGHQWLAVGSRLLRDGEPIFELDVDGDIQALAIDREGAIWLATANDGLHALLPAAAAMIGNAEGLPEDNIYAVYEDRSGDVWIGTHGAGAWRLSQGHLTQVELAGDFERPGDVERPSFPRAFLEDAEGTLWVGESGGLSGGVYRLVGDQLRRVSTESGEVPSRSVNALLEDGGGRLWTATEAGLYMREPPRAGSQARWRQAGVGRLPHPEVRGLALSEQGHLWIATAGGVVRRVAGARSDTVDWRVIDSGNGLPSDLVRSLYFDGEGILWIGTDDGGLARLDPATLDQPEGPSIVCLGTDQGLYGGGIHHIVEDGLGFFWMSSNQGIIRVPRAELEAFAAGEIEQIESVVYAERDGLRSREANGGSRNAGMLASDGRVWFATQAGAAVFDPRRLLADTDTPAPPRWEELVASDLVRRLTNADDTHVVLPETARTFSVSYTLLSLSQAHRARFRYLLDGYDQQWTNAGTRRQAYFTQVPAGTYVLRLEARGIHGNPGDNQATLQLTVLPFFHETLWFRGLMLLAGLAAGAALLQWRVAHQSARQTARQRELEQMVAQRTEVIEQQTEKLRQLDRLKSELFTNVSHEFRTPLTLAIGPLQDLLNGVRGDLDQGVEQDVRLSLRNARRVLGLIHQILDLARLEAGQVQLRARRSDLASFLRERLESFAPLGKRSGVTTSFTSSVDRLPVWFDPHQLKKAIDNLLANAFNLTPEGGQVSLDLGSEADKWARISVRDTGPGIPTTDLKRIFIRFQQGAGGGGPSTDQEVSRRWSGTGIGLAQAKELVELHRGTIQVESDLGKGANFIVSLRLGQEHFDAEELAGIDGSEIVEQLNDELDWPLVEARTTTTPSEQSGHEQTVDRATVLVVDDNPEIRHYVRRGLESEYRVLEAADGRQALRRAAEGLPDLIISDVMMPDMDGLVLVQALKADPELDFIPVILLTAKGSMENKLEGLASGVDDYLTKPFDSRELQGRVGNLIEGRRRWLAHHKPATGLSLSLPRAEAQPADQGFLNRVRDLIEENMDDADFGVESLATALRCDRSYLFRKLRELLGETPSGLLRRLRLERAEQLLSARVGSVSEVAYRVGFRGISHFSQSFRERYNATPSSYMRRAG